MEIMIEITKEYEISYAHRLLNHQGKCSRLHGHNAKICLSIMGPVIKDSKSSQDGMVMDFGYLDPIEKWMNKILDHRTVLEVGDPLIEAITSAGDQESLVVIDMPPTAELLATFIHAKVERWLEEDLDSLAEIDTSEFEVKVTFWETSKACATVDQSAHFFQVPLVEGALQSVNLE